MQCFGQNLFFALFFFGLFSCKPAIDQNKSMTFSSAEIFNGQKADPILFKQVVALIKEGDIICSAAAVKRRLLFTSAHCFIDFEELEVEDGGNSDNFDELFSSLDDDDYCQSFSECQEELDNLNNKTRKREYLEDHIDQLIEQLEEEMTIHIGKGVQGGSIEGEDIIKSIHIHPDWVYLLKLKLYNTFDVISRSQKVELKNIHEFDEYAFDYAQIKLKKSIPARKIIRPLKEESLENGIIPDGSKVILVGFGHQLPNNRAKEGEEEEYRLAYGVKMSVELPLAGIIRNDSGIFAISGGVDTGACQGDSGGGAFLKFPNGQLKYLGIITGGGDLCGEAVFWENNGTSIQGNTIINIQLNTDEI